MLGVRFSSSIARYASRILRASVMSVRSSSRIVFRTYCWVIVDAPSVPNPCVRFTTTARPRPEEVDALVLVEPLVLDGDDRVDQIG